MNKFKKYHCKKSITPSQIVNLALGGKKWVEYNRVEN